MTITEEKFIFYGDETEGYLLIGYCGQTQNVILPQDFQGQTYSIAARAFYGRSDLTGDLIIGDSVIETANRRSRAVTGSGALRSDRD